jgi:hypothetical protein
MVGAAVDRLAQTLERLFQQPGPESSSAADAAAYTILVQFSQALALREALVDSATLDAALYRQAGLRKPSENAQRDWYGPAAWWRRLVAQLAENCQGASPKQQQPRRFLLYLQTTPDNPPVEASAHVHILDASRNPWGWDDNDSDNKGSGRQEHDDCVGMDSLQQLWQAVERKIDSMAAPVTNPLFVTIAVGSLIPLWVRHGPTIVLRFLARLQGLAHALLLPCPRDVVGPAVHRALEDSAQAVLILDEGNAVWMHKGVRERDNVVREGIDFTLQAKEGQWRLGMRQPSDMIDPKTIDSLEVSKTVESTASRSQSSEMPSVGRARVRLRLEDEDEQTPSSAAAPLATVTPASTPLIYMQDDDPEFDDYDEEDPDDDLDI